MQNLSGYRLVLGWMALQGSAVVGFSLVGQVCSVRSRAELSCPPWKPWRPAPGSFNGTSPRTRQIQGCAKPRLCSTTASSAHSLGLFLGARWINPALKYFSKWKCHHFVSLLSCSVTFQMNSYIARGSWEGLVCCSLPASGDLRSAPGVTPEQLRRTITHPINLK